MSTQDTTLADGSGDQTSTEQIALPLSVTHSVPLPKVSATLATPTGDQIDFGSHVRLWNMM